MRNCSTSAARLILSALLVAICLVVMQGKPASAGGIGLPTATVPNGFGVSSHPIDYNQAPYSSQALPLLQASGIHVVRCDIFWSDFEGGLSSGFATYDPIINGLISHGMRPLLILEGWDDAHYPEPADSAFTSVGQSAFGNWVGQVAAHYANKNIIWEIWNEPDLSQFGDSPPQVHWKFSDRVGAYISLAQDSIAAIRQNDPTATILIGATSGFPLPYIEAILASGVAQGADAFSVHPYLGNAAPETVTSEYDSLRALIGRYTPPGAAPLPIVASESSWSSAGDCTPAQQPAFLLRQYLNALAAGVNLTTWYKWQAYTDDDTWNADYALVDDNETPRPVYTATENFISSLNGYRFCHSLATGAAGNYSMLFQNGSSLATVTWTTANDNSQNGPSVPAVTPVATNSPSYTQLQYAAAIQYTPDTRVAVTGTTIPVVVTITNPFSATATVNVSSNGQSLQPFTVAPGATVKQTEQAVFYGVEPVPQPMDLEFTWNGTPVTSLVPPNAVSASAFAVMPYASGGNLYVQVTNTSQTTFSGTVSYQMDGNSTPSTASQPINNLPAQATTTVAFAAPANQTGLIQVTDSSNNVWGRAFAEKYATDAAWPTATASSSPFEHIPVTNGSSGTPANLSVVAATQAGAPASVEIGMPYSVVSGSEDWDVLAPVSQDNIPAGADSYHMWVYNDGLGMPYAGLYNDQNGNNYQPNAGQLVSTGWELVNVPLDGTGKWYPPAGYPVGQSVWQNIAIADYHTGIVEHSGTLYFAAPFYGYPSFGSGYHFLCNVSSNDELVVSQGSTQDGFPLIQSWVNGTANGIWQLVLLSDGNYHIVNQNSGYLINIPGATTQPGTQLIQSSDAVHLNSEWKVVPVGGGKYNIVSAYDSQNIGVSGSSTVLGTAIDQETPVTGQANQQWYIY